MPRQLHINAPCCATRGVGGMSDAPKLKPCPFCGSEARLAGGPMAQESYSVWCVGPARHNMDYGFDREAAIAAWNTRADLSADLVRAGYLAGLESAASVAGYAGAIQDKRDGSYAGSEPVMGPDVADDILALSADPKAIAAIVARVTEGKG